MLWFPDQPSATMTLMMLRLKMLRRLAILLLWVGLASAAELAPSTPVLSAEQQTEHMLRAIGGRAHWAALTSLVNDSEQHRTEAPHTVRARISMDLRQPRWRIETTAADLHLIRVWDGALQRGWRLNRDGVVEDLPVELRDEDLRWHRGHVYRTLHRLAARDDTLSTRMKEGRLEVLEGADRIAWFQLSGNGEPYAFGAHDDDIGSRCGPWKHLQDGIRHPSWVANASGSWRVNLVQLETNTDLEAGLFARPQQLHGLSALHGSWQGEGTLQGQPARLALDIQPVLSGAHTQWQFQVEMGGQAVFSGLLHHRRELEGLRGEWRDSTGAVYPVHSEFRADCLVSDWQRGHSRYCLTAAGRMTVEDRTGSVAAGSEGAPFASYVLSRVEARSR